MLPLDTAAMLAYLLLLHFLPHAVGGLDAMLKQNLSRQLYKSNIRNGTYIKYIHTYFYINMHEDERKLFV